MNLYVGNLNYRVKESDLREVMEEYGTVDSVRIITDRETRRSKGFAFIEMPDSSEASNAVGVLLHDVDVTTGDANGTLLLFGFVNTNRIDEKTKAKLTDIVKKAMPMIKFVAC